MSENWIKGCKKALDRLNKLSARKEKDRLERVKSIKTSLALMGRSLSGWSMWANNPSAMANFSNQELAEMETQISIIAKSLIQFDLETAKIGKEKGLKKKTLEMSKLHFIA
jgi:hypothetical protein